MVSDPFVPTRVDNVDVSDKYVRGGNLRENAVCYIGSPLDVRGIAVENRLKSGIVVCDNGFNRSRECVVDEAAISPRRKVGLPGVKTTRLID